MKRALRIGISTCPNDTFAFHALLEGLVRVPGIEVAIELADIQELNDGMRAGRFDVGKVSAAAALAASGELVALRSGWALGHGVGPLLLARRGGSPAGARTPVVLSPGADTTAHLLWRLFHDEPARVEHVRFSEILPALAQGRADLGLCIHEARFTWSAYGVERVEDLGETWERRTGAPLPLGGPVARRDLDPGLLTRVDEAVAQSLSWALAHREACLPTMRRHAREQADEVLWAHVETYVNDWTLDLGVEGRRAFAALGGLARERGLVPAGAELGIRER